MPARHSTTRVACALLSSIVLATGAFARTCGDADGNFSVTTRDGVQVLRAAAGLPSRCTHNPPICDVDGNGTTSVTDGVNVLRKAAGLAIVEACPSGATPDVQAISDVVVPFLTQALAELRNIRTFSATSPGWTEDCEDSGTRTIVAHGAMVTLTLDGCQVSQPGSEASSSTVRSTVRSGCRDR